MDTKTGFVGRVSTSPDALNAAFSVKLHVTATHIEISSAEGGDRWQWPISTVSMSQVSVDRFHLELDNEELYFLPVDARGFVEHVVSRFSDEPVEPHRGWLRRRIEQAQASDVEAEGYEFDDTDIEIDLTAKGRRGHVHEWTEGKAAGVVTRKCVGCGQVSIDATGLTSSFESALASA